MTAPDVVSAYVTRNLQVTAREADHGRLVQAIASHADRGHTAPCLRWPDAGWTAEDVEEQQLAASLCHRCPAVELCRTYGLAFPHEFGVYGAMTDHERRPRLGRPRKTTEAAEEREAS